MELLLILTIHAIGLSALAVIRIGRSDRNIRLRQIFFFGSILLVSVATMVTTLLRTGRPGGFFDNCRQIADCSRTAGGCVAEPDHDR